MTLFRTTIHHTVQAAEEVPTALAFQSSDGASFTLTQARIHLRDIRLDLPKGIKCADVIGPTNGVTCKGSDSGGSGSGTLVVDGPLVVDLMTGVSTPDLSGVVIPAGNYKRIDFRLEEGHADELPATVRIDDRAKGECSGAEDMVKRNIKTSGDLRKQED